MTTKNLLLQVFFVFAVSATIAAPRAFGSELADYMVDEGIAYFKKGDNERALERFQKALMVDPDNGVARQYVGEITGKAVPVPNETATYIAPADSRPAIAGSRITQDLLDSALDAYNKGKEEEALDGFQKVLAVDPSNPTAREYISKLLLPDTAVVPPVVQPVVQPVAEPAARPVAEPVAQRAVEAPVEVPVLTEDTAPDGYVAPQIANLPSQIAPLLSTPAGEQKGTGASDEDDKRVKVSGEVQMSAGVDSGGDVIWKSSNFDLNEKGWRILSQDALNNKVNTYDPGIYDRLRFVVERQPKEGFGFRTQISIDPWAFTGKSDKITVTGANGDTAQVQYLSWSNTGYTANTSVRTQTKADAFNLREIKLIDGKVPAQTITSTWGTTFSVPEMDIDYKFQPVRELWFDYRQDDNLFRIFPLATQDQAYTSNDPLVLSNHANYWQASPWLRNWQPGQYNSEPNDFTQGRWDKSLSSLARDSDGAFLTGLRGFSIKTRVLEDTQFDSTTAVPLGYWDDYSDYDSLSSATRLRHRFSDWFAMGGLYTLHMGFNPDQDHETDAINQVGAVDADYQIFEGTKAQVEVASSYSRYDLTNDTYKTEKRGSAYYAALINRYPAENILDNSFDSIRRGKEEDFLSKTRLFFCHMDTNFDPTLSDYHQTRRDAFWSRHLTFRTPFDYYYSGMYGPAQSMNDITPFAIGDGIDIGRDTIGLRSEIEWGEKSGNIFDIRDARTVHGKHIETVTRDALTLELTDKLTGKALGIYQAMPKTEAGVDPFIYDSYTGEYVLDYSSDPIDANKDPSLKTGSLGLEYELTDWATLNGVWEHTNDYTLAYDNFPRGIFNSSQPGSLYTIDGLSYRRDTSFLYDQQLFPQAPYPFYDIFKAGVLLKPCDKLQMYFDWTRNEFSSAGQVSDSMNHVGTEIAYLPFSKLGFYVKYTYSRWKDLQQLQAGNSKVSGHHNIFAEMRYFPTKDDEFVLQYGVGGFTPIGYVTTDPFGGSLLTIDTQHIFRIYYRRRF